MKLADMTVAQFVDTVASDAPAPGGGSVAALAGSIGAALTAMVGNLTQGRKKYAQYAEFAAQVEKHLRVNVVMYGRDLGRLRGGGKNHAPRDMHFPQIPEQIVQFPRPGPVRMIIIFQRIDNLLRHSGRENM